MSLSDLLARLPAYARDLRRNLEQLLREDGAPGLTPTQQRAAALAAAITARHPHLVRAMETFAADRLDASELDGVRAAATLMAMTNVYHRATHLLGNPAYAAMRSGLRMNVLARPGIERVAYEIAALAASAINGCAACLDAHEATLRRAGVSADGVHSTLRIAAVIHAVAVTLEQQDADPR